VLARVVGASTISIMAIGVALWRAGWVGAPSSVQKLYAAVDEGALAFEQLDMLPLGSSSSDDIKSTLNAGSVKLGEGMTAADAAAVWSEAATFLDRRFLRADFAEYISWRESTGCKLRQADDVMANEHAYADYEKIMGAPLTAGTDVKSVFEAYWKVSPSRGDGLNRPRGIARTPSGATMTIGFSKDRYNPRLFLEGQLGSRLWYGPDSAAMRNWFNPPIQPKEIVKRYGRVAIAEVGIVVEWENGSRRPLIMGFFRHPTTARWVLWQVNQNNYDPKLQLSPMEF